MEITTQITKPERINPGISLFYGSPKVGKTTIVSQLEDHLIAELEPGGSAYISGRIQKISKASEFNEFLDLLANSPNKVCKYLVIDTITKLDEYSEFVGTWNYMNKPQGKAFNRVGGVSTGAKLSPTDLEYDTIYSLGQGYGYKYSREVMVEWIEKLQKLIELGKVEHVILLAHVKDKLVESRNGDSVETLDINLTGKVKNIYASKVDCVGHLYREKNKVYISFDNEHKITCGGRCSHLDKTIVVSEKMPDGTIKTFWENIFLPEVKK